MNHMRFDYQRYRESLMHHVQHPVLYRSEHLDEFCMEPFHQKTASVLHSQSVLKRIQRALTLLQLQRLHHKVDFLQQRLYSLI